MNLKIPKFFLSWAGIAAEAAVVTTSVWLWRCFFGPLSDLPGPLLARFSRLWHIQQIVNGRQNTSFVEIHRKHGHFVRIASNEVSVSHPDGVKKILLAQLPKAPWYTVLRFPDWRYEQPMSIQDPKKKIELSRSLAPPYSTSNILQQESAIDDVVDQLLDWMDRHAESGDPIQLNEFCTFTAFDIVGEVIFSKQFGLIKSGMDIGGAMANNKLLNIISAVLGYYTPWHYLLVNPITTELRVLPAGHLVDTAIEAVQVREKNPDARNDIAGHWLRVHRQNPERLTRRHIQAQATTNVAGGGDSVSCGMQGTLYHMMRDPAVWARARKEIDEAVTQGRCGGRVISFADAQSLTYLQACIKEALRFFAPVPLGLPRLAPKGGVTIGDRTFPEGTILSINPWVIHRSEELWGPDVDEFNPDRWLRKDASSLEKYWIPYGAGYCICPGNNLARVEISKICATILRDYDVSLVDPNRYWTYKAYLAIFLNPWPIQVKKRYES